MAEERQGSFGAQIGPPNTDHHQYLRLALYLLGRLLNLSEFITVVTLRKVYPAQENRFQGPFWSVAAAGPPVKTAANNPARETG
jgi:ribosomal protein S19E (S16A)